MAIGFEYIEGILMSDQSIDQNARKKLRDLMESFIEERLQAKLEKLQEDDAKRLELREQYQFDRWIEDAARRVTQIQLVTHALKATHPDAKGSSLYVNPKDLTQQPYVGTHVLGDKYHDDVVGNAAALDVYKFLKLRVDNKSILSHVLSRDPALFAALSSDEEQASAWVEAFASITSSRGDVSSHSKAKQLYFLAGDDPADSDDFHLLAPLYATSLAHELHLRIREDKFGESAKAARQARRDGKPFPHGFREYPELAIQKLGGTKPQNISQLNSERGGQNYLLASLPPNWKSTDIKPPLNVDSVFVGFGFRPPVRFAVDEMNRFFASDPPRTLGTRNTRDRLFNDVQAELWQFAAEIRSLPAGWSADERCQLHVSEQLWLDPGRSEMDPAFKAQWQDGDWVKGIADRFGNWLNHRLAKHLLVGDAEHRNWSGRFGRADDLLRQLYDDQEWVATVGQLEEEIGA